MSRFQNYIKQKNYEKDKYDDKRKKRIQMCKYWDVITSDNSGEDLSFNNFQNFQKKKKKNS